jgi:hypothetical protein
MDPASQAIVRRWRRIFLGLYIGLVVVASLVTFFSVAAVNFGFHRVPIKGTQISAKADQPKELRDCQRRLERLLNDLHRETFTLLAKAQRFGLNVATEWRNWSSDWRHRWRVLDWRCRLSELADKGVSPEIDKMAEIHGALDELHISYSGVVSTFAERYVDRLRNLRQEVDEVRAMINRRRAKKGLPSPSSSGATQ